MTLYKKSSAAWATIGYHKIYYRSLWERNYARFLEWQKQCGFIEDWQHEPETFWFLEIKRGVRSYLPDFKVINNDQTHYWVEVKGFMDSKSVTKLKRFKKYYPQEKIIIISSKWFSDNNQKMRLIIPTWETGV